MKTNCKHYSKQFKCVSDQTGLLICDDLCDYLDEEPKLKNLGEGEAGTGYALLSDVADLRPCPFCGGQPTTTKEYDGDLALYNIKCLNENCIECVETGQKTEYSLCKEAWNDRV